eukprot:Phypoly_transcript_13582.p1 GENE.Phypoly_transcript_13582~~Phypoly_transcript_13582.p1  ORF type:complete len:259 (-),score=58.09 Phypoly_transcript_13582:62-838(-)
MVTIMNWISFNHEVLVTPSTTHAVRTTRTRKAHLRRAGILTQTTSTTRNMAAQAVKPAWDSHDMDKFLKTFATKFRDTYIAADTPHITPEELEKQHTHGLLEKSDIGSFVKAEANRRDKAKRERQLKRKLAKKGKDAGPQWFGMKAPRMTDEVIAEVKLIKLQHVLDKKYRYNKDDEVMPKHFELGTYVDAPDDYYNRNTRKEKNTSMADAMMQKAKHTKDGILKKLQKNEIRKKAMMNSIAKQRRNQKQGAKKKSKK